MGKVIGAKYIVLGTVSRFGNTYTIDARLVDVESSESVRSGDYTTSNAVDNLLLQGVKSVVLQLTGDGVAEPNNQYLEDSSPEPKIWDTEDYISYFRIGFDLEGSLTEYSIIGVDDYNGFEGYGKPSTGLNLGYEYASPNGFGFGLDFQFFRSFDIKESDFRYTSIYGIWNSTFSNGFSLFSKAGYSSFSKEGFDTVNYDGFDPFSEEEIDYFESQFIFETGFYYSFGFRRPISDSMHLECGFSVNTVSQKLRSEHTYSRPYVGLSFLF